ncbi:hypothetical protein F5J12DRAFT_917819 [Pisolithus orientalis]|uniref:uncharacterized protein n=1 Tax=Pisolithus orientalis TaxID=936130 RepID=UPI0022247532|nr:uncharacterized protein F5J12DRAFT_917819 [Pisolithus orientalis]KAI6035126.1 hypothetical protein F5J12DRAFT_917819 [Pisolithus orientalis]
MDKYITVRKPALVSPPKKTVPSPYPRRTLLEKVDEDKQRLARISAPLYSDGKKPSNLEVTKHLLRTLADESNPITHSNIYERSDTVVSATNGHQRGERRGHCGARQYFDDRNRKLAAQSKEEPTTGVLRGVRVYISGYLSGTTDIEMKHIVALAGGTTLLTPNGATHILTSQQLSGSKTHKLLTSKRRNLVHVVKPEWVTDSVKAGKRLHESRYAVVLTSSTRNLVDMMKASKSN